MLKLINNLDEIIKPIFSSRLYLEFSLGFCDLCFALIDCENELFFECEICQNIVACHRCIKQKTRHVISHSFDHHFRPKKPPSNTHWTKRHWTITCNLCGEENFFGKRYQCRQCSDFNVCSTCLPKVRLHHHPTEQHTFICVFNPTKIHNNRCLLAHRTLQILHHRNNADSTVRDEMTGWSSTEAEVIYTDEMTKYYAAWKQASDILDDDDIDSIPSIIEHERTALPSVLIDFDG